MSILRCIIVEDEPLAAEGLAEFIRDTPFLELSASFETALAAAEYVRNNQTDVIFLDIHLPKMKGLDFLRSLRNPPQIILTTAYHHYAVEGFDLNVVDYLLKPFGFQRYLAAVNKLLRTSGASERKFYFFNVDKKRIKLFEDDIIFVESLKEYVKIHTAHKAIITKIPLSGLEEMLGSKRFLRIHKSYLVASDKIESYTATEIEACGKKLPIGRTYKDFVLAYLDSL